MTTVGYYNGEIGDIEEMKIPMLDRAVFFGDGCYDATTFCNNTIFACKEHFDRFYNSCRLLEIPFTMTREELKQELQKLVDLCPSDHGFLYWQVSRGTGPRAHQFPSADVKPNLLAYAMPRELVPMDTQARLISMPDTRFLHCNIKTLNLIPSVIAYQRCIEQDCFETVFYREGGIVTECAHSNILMIKDGVLCTHPRDNLILPGITLGHLLMFAEQNGMGTREAPFTMDELRDADEIIISSCGGLCTRAVELDGKPVGGKAPELVKMLQETYMAYYKKETGC